jgi:hypothetical protein
MPESDNPSEVSNGRKVWNDAMRRLTLVAKLRVRVGVLAAQGGSNVQEGSDITLIELAAIHEFGSPAAHIPERSFIRSTFKVHARDALRSKMSVLCKAALSGKVDPHRAIELLGLWAASAVKRSITTRMIRQELKPATIRAKTVGGKKGDVALVDEGQLLNAITYDVDKESGQVSDSELPGGGAS